MKIKSKVETRKIQNDDEDASMDEPAAKYESDDLKKMLVVSTNSLFAFLKRGLNKKTWERILSKISSYANFAVSLLNHVEESQRTVDFIRDIARIDIDKTTKVSFLKTKIFSILSLEFY